MNRLKKLAKSLVGSAEKSEANSSLNTSSISILALLFSSVAYSTCLYETVQEITYNQFSSCIVNNDEDSALRVFYLQGTVLVNLSNGPKPLNVGDRIRPESVVEVSSDGFVGLIVPGSSEVYLQPLTVTDFSCREMENIQLHFTVASPYLMAAVRG